MNARRALNLTVLTVAPFQWTLAQNETGPRLIHRAPTEEQRAALLTSDQFRQQEAEWEANMRIEVRAIGEVGGEVIAFVYVNEEPGYVAKGVDIASWTVETVDPATQTLTLEGREKQRWVLPVTNPQSFPFPQLSYEEFYRLREQAGWVSPGYFSSEVRLNWRKMDAKTKEVLLLEALSCGAVMGPRTGLHGNSSSGTTLFQKEMMRRRAALQEKFEASLTAEQKSD